MRNYSEKDIRFYDESKDIKGDFIVSETGDFALTSDHESARQDINNRLATQKTDWRSHKNLGADLELLEGEMNTRETGQRAESQVYEALTYDRRFNAEDVDVRAVPSSIEQIDLYVMLDSDKSTPIVVSTELEL